MTPVERVINRAKAEVGYLEKKTNSQLDSKTANAGYGNFTKYMRDLDALGIYDGKKNGYAWCDGFVDWTFISEFGVDIALKMLHQPKGGYGASCTSSYRYYQEAGAAYSSPEIGDQIFFKATDWGMAHTGIVINVDNNYVYTIEGNTSSAAGVVDNGGCVAIKSYPINYSRIGGYGRPDWSLVAEEEEEMTDEIFEEFSAKHDKKVAEKPGSSWSKESRDWAVSIGLIKGAGRDAEGNPIYMWQSDITREAMIEVLYRFAQMMNKN